MEKYECSDTLFSPLFICILEHHGVSLSVHSFLVQYIIHADHGHFLNSSSLLDHNTKSSSPFCIACSLPLKHLSTPMSDYLNLPDLVTVLFFTESPS